MIEKKELLSENLKDFMDYSLEVMKSMDGAADHNPNEIEMVNDKIDNLKEYLDNLKASYNEHTQYGNGSAQAEISDIVL